MEDTTRYECIVLDLDGSLIYSSEENEGEGRLIKFTDIYGDISELWVHKRPGFDEFLQACFRESIVGVWSMGQPGYVEAVISLFPQKPAFVYNWCNCDRSPGRIFKRLNNIPYSGRILMIDDNRNVLEECERVETVIIPEWTPENKDDQVLYNLIYNLGGNSKRTFQTDA